MLSLSLRACLDSKWYLQATYSALILACLDNHQLERAGELYQVALEAGLHPDVHAYNGLINTYGRASEVECHSMSVQVDCILANDCMPQILYISSAAGSLQCMFYALHLTAMICSV